jgi:hypothetical protein
VTPSDTRPSILLQRLYCRRGLPGTVPVISREFNSPHGSFLIHESVTESCAVDGPSPSSQKVLVCRLHGRQSPKSKVDDDQNIGLEHHKTVSLLTGHSLTDSHRNMNDPNNLSTHLQEQYKHVEEYCNAQTRLYNATISSKDTADAVANLSQATRRIRQDLQKLQNFQQDQHLEVSRRLIQTIGRNPSWHADGLPEGSSKVQVYTVALATLKASIAQVLESEQ